MVVLLVLDQSIPTRIDQKTALLWRFSGVQVSSMEKGDVEAAGLVLAMRMMHC